MTNTEMQNAPAPVAPMPPPINKLMEALAKAQAGFTNPPRNREVEVFSARTQSRYKFKYATLDAIIDHVRPHLTANGLWFFQTIEPEGGNRHRLVTTLAHSSGQFIRSETPILAPTNAGNQEFGSALSYMRRYALTALLGIAADEDDDANAADGNTVENTRERAPASRSGGQRSQGSGKQQPRDSQPENGKQQPRDNQSRTAAPKGGDDDAWKKEATRVKRLIQNAKTFDQVEEIVRQEGATLKGIKDKSESAYQHIMDCATDRKEELATAEDRQAA